MDSKMAPNDIHPNGLGRVENLLTLAQDFWKLIAKHGYILETTGPDSSSQMAMANDPTEPWQTEQNSGPMP
jgi:hypothetical protein